AFASVAVAPVSAAAPTPAAAPFDRKDRRLSAPFLPLLSCVPIVSSRMAGLSARDLDIVGGPVKTTSRRMSRPTNSRAGNGRSNSRFLHGKRPRLAPPDHGLDHGCGGIGPGRAAGAGRPPL